MRRLDQHMRAYHLSRSITMADTHAECKKGGGGNALVGGADKHSECDLKSLRTSLHNFLGS